MITDLTCFLPGVDINKNGKGEAGEYSHFIAFSMVQPKLFAEFKSTIKNGQGGVGMLDLKGLGA